MGAVKTNRRILTNPHYQHGALYSTKGTYERWNKEAERFIQSYEDMAFGIEEKLQYRDINNRRKMHGQPLIRRVMS